MLTSSNNAKFQETNVYHVQCLIQQIDTSLFSCKLNKCCFPKHSNTQSVSVSNVQMFKVSAVQHSKKNKLSAVQCHIQKATHIILIIIIKKHISTHYVVMCAFFKPLVVFKKTTKNRKEHI